MKTSKLNNSKKRAVLLGAGAIFLWCWTGVCFRKGAELMGSSMVYLTLVAGGGALTAVILQQIRRKPIADIVRLPRRMMVAGFFGVSLYNVMIAAAFGIAPETDIGQINLLNYFWPAWLVVLGILLLDSRPQAIPAIAGVLLGLFGVVISRGFDLFAHLPHNIFPHILALSGGFLWALYVVMLRRWNIPPEKGGTAFHFAVCAVIAGSMAALQQAWTSIPPWSWSMLFWIVIGAIGPVGIAYTWYEISVKDGPVLLIASLAFFAPIGSSLLIGLFFKESMNNGLMIGAAAIAAGAWLVRRAGQNRGNP